MGGNIQITQLAIINVFTNKYDLVTSAPWGSVGALIQVPTVGVDVTRPSEVRCGQPQEVHHYFEFAGPLRRD